MFFNRQFYGPRYSPWDTPAIHDVLHRYAPEGFDTAQKDLYYLLSAIRVFPPFNKAQTAQWSQYSKIICDLINMIGQYPNPCWDLLDQHLSTQGINLPLAAFYDPKNATEGLSKTAFARFINRANRMVQLLWLILLQVIANEDKPSASS